ncbi:SDR family oxidoreductase [Gammaproteobacteria bacterium]|nr:SDR family oxidoreductase [Gammaproteobacteria bacterium]
MKTILITGATGLLGSSLVPHFKGCGYKVVTHAFSSKADFMFDLADKAKTLQMLNEINPTQIINLVSMTSVEKCEEKVNLAYLANTHSVENLAHWLRTSKNQCHLIHISTDHVYDGDGISLNKEDDIKITNTYALTKYAGELALSNLPCTVLRTNFVGKSRIKDRESLTDWVFKSSCANANVNVLDDVYFNPLSISILCEMIEIVVKKNLLGTYNLGSRNGMSKADFDFVFAEYLDLSTNNMNRIGIGDATFFKAYRPKDMRTDVSKFEKSCNIQLPELNDIIKQVANEYKSKS